MVEAEAPHEARLAQINLLPSKVPQQKKSDAATDASVSFSEVV